MKQRKGFELLNDSEMIKIKGGQPTPWNMGWLEELYKNITYNGCIVIERGGGDGDAYGRRAGSCGPQP